MHSDSFGTMDGAYFVSRSELLQWVNTNFNQHISKIEELSTGAVFCQIFQNCMPGSLKISKVNFQAKHNYESISNFKLLQEAFIKNNVKKNIEIEKLVRGKCQDNLEFLQWMKRFFDGNLPGKVEVRNVTPNARSRVLTDRNRVDRVRNSDKSVDSVRNLNEIKEVTQDLTGIKDVGVKKGSVKKNAGLETGKVENKIRDKVVNAKVRAKPKEKFEEGLVGDAGEAKGALNGDMKEIKDAESEKSRIAMDILQKERDFYFEKLREIESLVRGFEEPDHVLVRKLQAILYLEEA